MDALQNLYAQVNQQQQQWPQQHSWPPQQQAQRWPQQPSQQQQWPPQQQQQWPPQQQQRIPQQQRVPQQQPQNWSQPQELQQQTWAQQHQQQEPQWSYQQQPMRPKTPPAQWPPQQQQDSQQMSSPFSSMPSSSNQHQFQQPMYDDGFEAYKSSMRPGKSAEPLPPAIPLRRRLSDAILPLPSEIKQGGSSQQDAVLHTLTEPVSATLARDAKRVASNLQHIIIPTGNRADPARTLRDWDLWGPFFFIITLSCILSSTASQNKSTVFAVVFAVLSAGAIALTSNVVLLGGKLNFFQSLSVLGYCLFPLDIGAIVGLASSSKLYKTFVVFLALTWCSWSVYPFVSTVVRPSRKALAVYPVFLMYISVGFLVLANE